MIHLIYIKLLNYFRIILHIFYQINAALVRRVLKLDYPLHKNMYMYIGNVYFDVSFSLVSAEMVVWSVCQKKEVNLYFHFISLPLFPFTSAFPSKRVFSS